jgi:hypothetical protein
MTLREKQRLRRIIKANTEAYQEARRSIVLRVMRGDTDESGLRAARWELTVRSLYVVEAVASLEDHGGSDE